MASARTLLDSKRLYKFRYIKKDPSDPKIPDASKLRYIERIFTHYELHFPSPIDLNDPLECKPLFTIGDLSDHLYKEKFVSHARSIMLENDSSKQADEVTNWLNSLSQQQATALAFEQSRGYRKEMENLRICSFCANPDNPIVWSHYADSHKGFCLVFDANNDLFGEAQQVFYQEEYPTIDVTEENQEVIFQNTALVKYKDWAYESEFRLLSKEPGSQGMLPVKDKKLVYPPEMLVGVILGSQISDSDHQLIEEYTKERPAGFIRKAVISDSRYRLRIVDI